MTASRTMRGLVLGGAVALPLLLAGCGSAREGTSAQGHPSHGASAAHGAAVAETRDAADAHSPAAGEPPESAQMVCGAEIRSAVVEILHLTAAPATRHTWANSVYTCTYSLPMGPMVLTVDVAPDTATAGRTFDALPSRLPGSKPVIGLGERAQGTPDGTVEVLKDNQILTVDTTGLPEVFGSNGQQRFDLAYEVAANVMGCWIGDEHG